MLWRHGQTIWNAEHRFQGQQDIALDGTGEAQAERAAGLLARLSPDLIVASDLQRAVATATPLARLTGLPIAQDKDLRERFAGAWEGLTDKEIAERYPAELASWTPPGGETAPMVADRVSGAFLRVATRLSETDGRLAVIASHGGALRLGMARLLELTDELAGVLGPLSNGSWSVLGNSRGRWRLLEYNAGTLPQPVLGDDR